MHRAGLLVALCLVVAAPALDAQRRQPARKPAAARRIEPAQVACPESLGTGVKTKLQYCFVLVGRDPADGVIVKIPPHTGEATLLFNLHNRHTYSESEVKAGKGFATYTAIIGALTMKGELLGRGAVQSEFRSAGDLYDRISGGAGPGGVKAVAPLGCEAISIPVPQNVDQVSLLGEILQGMTSAGPEVASPGRPVAIISDVRVEYRPRR